jgi:molybdopterin adenylyltransferase
MSFAGMSFSGVIRVAVVTISDSAVAGTREDRSGPALAQRVERFGWTVAQARLVRDEVREIATVMAELADSGGVDVVLSTGGTGLAPRGVTPEAVRSIADREAPGFGEVMRAKGRIALPTAALSRGGGYTRGPVLILTFPGSPRGAVESLEAVADLIPHAVNLLHGKTEHHAQPQA